jgi:formylglycine-generating enzyme required for sulfatase activity
MLIEQASTEGTIPEGRAALFTGFVREMLFPEVEARNALFRADGVLSDRDRDRVAGRAWQNPHSLPTQGPLIPSLSAFAFGLQERRKGRELAQLRASYDEALDLLGPNRAVDILRAGVAIQALDDDRPRDEVLFVHQLLQEYFAARAVASAKGTAKTVALARVPWRESDLPPVRFESDNDPLPPAPPTGWEETFLLAAAMAPDPDAFSTALMEGNLPLAGRCAAQPDVKVSPHLRARLQQQLVERSRHSTAALRSRIAAARSLGELGDPRFERRTGPFGDYRLPPFVEIAGDEYLIGSDRDHDDERPAHRLSIERFEMAAFPITNAEWRLFMAAGGYDDDRWWDTEAAKRWRRGEGTAEGPKSQLRENWTYFQQDFDQIRGLEQKGRITSRQADTWEVIARMSETEFEALLDEWYPAGRRTQPVSWNDPAYNHPSQPVVGVCWYEARAYCAWVSAQSGSTITLPTEAQWEAAARGRKGRQYASGNDFDATRCNTFETHVRSTTPIGVFPRGDTPHGLADMTGNVWDWTSSAYQPYPYIVGDGREDATRDDVRRVVRGGSWRDPRDLARASFRRDSRPDLRFNFVGFRVVRVSPIR